MTPTYYVMFTTATIITSAILFQGFKGTAVQITTVIIGFLQICAGVVLLQLSKSAKDVPDAAVFKGDLDQIREVATVEEPESEPKADSIRGAASIIRRISTARRTMETDEARRFFHDKHEDTLKPPSEHEIIEWDGLRRRKTVIGEGPTMSRPITPRTPSVRHNHPPWGMSHFPEEEKEEEEEIRPSTKQSGHSFMDSIRSRAASVLHPSWKAVESDDHKNIDSNTEPVGLTALPQRGPVDTGYHGAAGPDNNFNGRGRSDTRRSVSWVDEKNDTLVPEPLGNTVRRQFSWNNVVNRMKSGSESSVKHPPGSPRGILRRTYHGDFHNTATEEESLGLVHGDSRVSQPEEEPLQEKMERWSSGESDLERPEPRYARGHGESVSSTKTAAFPAYVDNQHAFDSNPYYVNQTPEHDWQTSNARNRARSNSSAHNRAPPPAQSSFSTHRVPNPLAPVYDITPTTTLDLMPTTTNSGMRNVSEDSGTGATSVSEYTETQEPPPPIRRQSGWRRHPSDDSDDEYRERGSYR